LLFVQFAQALSFYRFAQRSTFNRLEHLNCVVMIGIGHLGLVCPGDFADFGHNIVCGERDAAAGDGGEACLSSTCAIPPKR